MKLVWLEILLLFINFNIIFWNFDFENKNGSKKNPGMRHHEEIAIFQNFPHYWIAKRFFLDYEKEKESVMIKGLSSLFHLFILQGNIKKEKANCFQSIKENSIKTIFPWKVNERK